MAIIPRGPCEESTSTTHQYVLNLSRPIPIKRRTIAQLFRDPNLGGCNRVTKNSARILRENVPPSRTNFPAIQIRRCKRIIPSITRVLCENVHPLRFPTQSEPHNHDQTSHGDQERIDPSDSPSPVEKAAAAAAASSAVVAHRGCYSSTPCPAWKRKKVHSPPGRPHFGSAQMHGIFLQKKVS